MIYSCPLLIFLNKLIFIMLTLNDIPLSLTLSQPLFTKERDYISLF